MAEDFQTQLFSRFGKKVPAGTMLFQEGDRGEEMYIIQSGKAAPQIPRFLHRALARAAVSILPPLVRDRLELGREYDLTFADRIAIKLVAKAAERKHDPASPPAKACVRMGLPSNFLYLKPAEQQRLLRITELAAA